MSVGVHICFYECIVLGVNGILRSLVHLKREWPFKPLNLTVKEQTEIGVLI